MSCKQRESKVVVDDCYYYCRWNKLIFVLLFYKKSTFMTYGKCPDALGSWVNRTIIDSTVYIPNLQFTWLFTRGLTYYHRKLCYRWFHKRNSEISNTLGHSMFLCEGSLLHNLRNHFRNCLALHSASDYKMQQTHQPIASVNCPWDPSVNQSTSVHLFF